MNPAHLHLITSHVPVLGSLFGLCLLLFALLRKSEELKRVALLVFLVAALLAVPAYLSGTPASTLLKRLRPGTTMDAGDLHAEIAILALAGSLTLGVVSLVGLILFRKGRNLPAGFLMFVLLLSLVACGLMSWTANLGGKIRHNEIRPQSSTPSTLRSAADTLEECRYSLSQLKHQPPPHPATEDGPAPAATVRSPRGIV